jgi:heme-degrading monooxygenase HmoA
MHARVTTVTEAADIDAGLALLRGQVVPQMQQQKGFRGLNAAGDRATGVLTVLSLWDSRADLEASESAADRARASVVPLMGGHVSVESYEETVCEASDEMRLPGAKLHIRRFKIHPNRIDDNLDFFRQKVLPDMKTRPGFLGVRQLIDRHTGEGLVGSLWIDEASLQASLAQSEQSRTNAMDRGIEFGEGQVLRFSTPCKTLTCRLTQSDDPASRLMVIARAGRWSARAGMMLSP